mmetsp:Transcript_4437/g.13238  ORF Transcript_4437/g.13238 Transcript_4437/m.13238 type:complete len:593 (+) Transcript_4437:3900-5678(+)
MVSNISWDRIAPAYNFDSLLSASITLFRLTTIKFVDVIRAGMDVTDRDISPSEDYSFANCLFMVVYLILAAFFVMNVFIAFIVDGFNLNRGSSPVDISYNKFHRLVDSRAPREVWFRPPKFRFCRSVRVITESAKFKSFSLGCVALNVIFMLTDHADAVPSFEQFMNAQSTIFFLELVIEVILNLVAYGPGGFIDDSWKLFDFLVMLGSASSYVTSNSTIGRAAKVFRLLRVIRLMRMIKAVRGILETMISSLPQFANIFLLLFLTYSIFATIFVQEIGLTRYGERLGPTAHFESFVQSIMTIYQLVIEDEWMTIMDDASVQPPECTPRFEGHNFGDCGVAYAWLLFIPFKLICESIMLNLFIGVILEKFAFITDEISSKEDPAWSAGPSGDQFQGLVNNFGRFARCNCISIQAATTSLLQLQPVPLGFRLPEHRPHTASTNLSQFLDSNHAKVSEPNTPFGALKPSRLGGAGRVEMEAPERAARKMIRAELNVVLRRRRQEEERFRRQWGLLWLLASVFPSPHRHFINGVLFSDVAKALLHWRKPSLLPEAVKSSQVKDVEETVVMSCTITIVEFFRALVAKRRQVETGNS